MKLFDNLSNRQMEWMRSEGYEHTKKGISKAVGKFRINKSVEEYLLDVI